MTSTRAVKPRSARRDRIRLAIAGAGVVLAGAGVLAGCASLGPAMATPVVTQTVQGPLSILQAEASSAVESAEIPAEGVAPAALPDFSGSLSAEAIAEVAPVVQAAPAETKPAASDGGVDVEYAGESDTSVAESAPAAPSNAGSGHGIDYYYTLDGYAETTEWGQQLIDACTGGVTEMGSYSIESGAPRTFALHSHCGGDAVTYASEGSTVAIGSNIYVLGPIVARLSIYEHRSDDVPHVGDALWQSCYNGAADMAFRSLTLIR